MKKQTAVEYFDEHIQEYVIAADHIAKVLVIQISFDQYMDIKSKAKQMEKQQIIHAFIDGEHQQGFDGEAQQYYNETYNK